MLVGTKSEAFKRALHEYQQPLYYFLRKTGLTHEDADELLQEMFLKLWKSNLAEQDGDNLLIILYRLLVPGCLVYLQSNRHTDLKGLSPEQQIIIVLKAQEGFNYQDIAQITGRPVNELRNLFQTGLIKFNDQPTL